MKRRGLSLAETLLSLFLLGLIISVAADLTLRARKLMFLARQRSELQDAAFALQRLALQSLSASQIVQPHRNSNSDRLQFQRVRPDLPLRLPTTLGADPLPVPVAPPTWDPLDASYQESVLVYSIDGIGLLLNSPADGEVLLCPNAQDFRSQSTGNLLTLSATLTVRGQQHQLTAQQWLAPGISW